MFSKDLYAIGSIGPESGRYATLWVKATWIEGWEVTANGERTNVHTKNIYTSHVTHNYHHYMSRKICFQQRALLHLSSR